MPMSKVPHSGSICEVRDPANFYFGRLATVRYLVGPADDKIATLELCDQSIGLCVRASLLRVVRGIEVSA